MTNGSTAPVVGVKRQRPASLLPAFEPLSSSPSLPRPQKRVAHEDHASMYPTPLPTSSTHIMSSSPPRMILSRPDSRRSFAPAAGPERAPLSAVPTLMLSQNGDPISMGRSSVSCNHQLSANRMISRVHVQAAYKPAPNPFDRDRVEIRCVGWNGIKLHCQGKTYDLAKGKIFSSDIKDADIMIDVHDARVLVQWPRNDERKERAASTTSEQSWDDDPPPIRAHQSLQETIHQDHQRLASPVSPSPVAPASSSQHIPPSSPPPKDPHNAVLVYEDEPSPSRHRQRDAAGGTPSEQLPSEEQVEKLLSSSQSGDLSDLSKHEDESSDDNDEENDPIVHSFGPFGENILPRMASVTASGHPAKRSQSPTKQDQPSLPADGESEPKPELHLTDEHVEQIQNHAANQLAFSRLSSTPLSAILKNFPASIWERDDTESGTVSKDEVRYVIDNTDCLGKVAREGKDAAGKPLETEYYYIADFDKDAMRRDAVVYELRKPGLRNCRKQHKVWINISMNCEDCVTDIQRVW